MDTQKPDSDEKKEQKVSVKNIAAKLVDADQWKSSKIGYITGVGLLMKSASTVSNALSGSKANLTSLVSTLFTPNERSVPGLDDPNHFTDASARFEAAVKLQDITPNKLLKIRRSTRRSAYLYLSLLAFYTAIAILTIIVIPPSSLFVLVARFGPAVLLLSLAFKSAFTNWCVRSRLATGPLDYLKSKDWLPKA